VILFVESCICSDQLLPHFARGAPVTEGPFWTCRSDVHPTTAVMQESSEMSRLWARCPAQETKPINPQCQFMLHSCALSNCNQNQKLIEQCEQGNCSHHPVSLEENSTLESGVPQCALSALRWR
jgi:hypothetical protein